MSAAAPARPRVALFVSCLVNVFRPTVAEAAIALLEEAGCEVEVPLAQSCCGQPGYNAGAIAAARPLAQNLIGCFEGYDYVVAPTGSCVGMIVEHYPRLLVETPGWHERALALAGKTHELTHFLHAVRGFVPAPRPGGSPVTYHDSCAGLRELGVREQPRALLAYAGVQVQEMQGTEICCGFGGAFCAKLPAISTAMADEKLANAVASGASMLAGGDLGCLLHLAGRARATGVALEFRHVAEVLADAHVAGMARSYGPADAGAVHARDKTADVGDVGAGHARDKTADVGAGHARDKQADAGTLHAHDKTADVGAGHARDAAAPVAPPQTSPRVHLGSEPG